MLWQRCFEYTITWIISVFKGRPSYPCRPVLSSTLPAPRGENGHLFRLRAKIWWLVFLQYRNLTDRRRWWDLPQCFYFKQNCPVSPNMFLRKLNWTHKHVINLLGNVLIPYQTHYKHNSCSEADAVISH